MHLQERLFEKMNSLDLLSPIFDLLGTPSQDVYGVLRRYQMSHGLGKHPGKDLREEVPNAPPPAIDLMKTMLVYNPAKRPAAFDCLQHEYFASIFNEADLKLKPFRLADFI